MITTPTATLGLLDLDHLEALADAMPEHLQLKGWYVAALSFGKQHVYADNVKGQGRQHIASLPAHKTYFAGLAEFIAAFDPNTVKQLITLARRAQPEDEAPQTEELVHALRQAERLLRAAGFAMTGTASPQIVAAIAAHAAVAQHDGGQGEGGLE